MTSDAENPTAEQLDAAIVALGRPTLARVNDAIMPAAVKALRQRQLDWDLAFPDKAAEHARLVRLANQRAAADAEARMREAHRKGDLERVRRMAGDRIGDNLEAPREEAPLVTARAWLQRDEWCLSLIGRPGNGKTYSAAWVALNAGWWPAVWLNAPEACARPLYGPEALASSERAQKARLLVLDDFGAELASTPWTTWLEAVLGVRYARGLKTVITSNLDAAGYRARLGERLADRVREGCVFESAGKSLRGRGGRVAA